MSQDISFLWPYDEVKISFQGSVVHVAAPWAKAHLDLPLKVEAMERIERSLRDGPASPDDLAAVHAICDRFRHLPFFFLLPREGLQIDPATEWQPETHPALRWAEEDFLERSQNLKGSHDPLSVLSCFRRCHLVDAMNIAQGTQISRLLKDAPIDLSLQALAYAIRQNHYVTVRCADVLAPALNLHPGARPSVEEFIRDESGHDELLALSLKALGHEPASIAVASTLVELMNHFEETANRDLVAFAFIVDVFERSSPTGRSPLIDKLMELGQEAAARPLKAHANINVHGGHHEESFEILEALGALTESSVRSSARRSQRASDLMLDFSRERAEEMRRIVQK